MPASSYYVNDWLSKNDCPFEWSEHKGYSGVGVSILFYRSRDFLTYPRHVHYTFLKEDDTWNENINSLVVLCLIDFKNMKMYNNILFLYNKVNLLYENISKLIFLF